jgi:hypothetical protein
MNLTNMIPEEMLRYVHGQHPPLQRQPLSPRPYQAPRNVVNLSDFSSDDAGNSSAGSMQFPSSPTTALHRSAPGLLSPQWQSPRAHHHGPPREELVVSAPDCCILRCTLTFSSQFVHNVALSTKVSSVCSESRPCMPYRQSVL